MSVFRAGSTIPIKFQLKTASGAVIQTGSLPIFSVSPLQTCMAGTVDESTSTTAGDTASTYRWDSRAEQHIYNYKSPSSASDKCQFVRATLDDGTTQSAHIRYR